MGTKSYIHRDDQTECYLDSSILTLNFLCKLRALFSVEIEDGFALIHWLSDLMPKKLSFPMKDINRIKVDSDGLFIEMPEKSSTAMEIWLKKNIEAFKCVK